MANFFANSGYVTGMFGKWHLGDNYPYRPQDRGFHEVVTHGGGGIGNTPDYWGNKYFDDTYWTRDGYQKYEGYCTDIWFAEALSFIERNRERPFFCYIPTNAPHWPHLVPPAFSDPYLDKVPHRERAKFFGMVECIDHNFGVLRQKLAEWGLAHNTIVIFMTDNGSWGGVDVDAAGRYQFELCRWPKEEDRALVEGIAGPPPVALIDMTLETGYGGGVAIPIERAAIRVGDQAMDTNVTADAKAATFTLDVIDGETHLQTYLYTSDGAELGAYYVYITRVS